MRTTKQPEAETLEVMDILKDLKLAVLDALLRRVRNSDVTTEELIQIYLSFKR